jgi:hypothetical protein
MTHLKQDAPYVWLEAPQVRPEVTNVRQDRPYNLRVTTNWEHFF